jgi:membrane protease YdiL (CAAX protease family)
MAGRGLIPAVMASCAAGILWTAVFWLQVDRRGLAAMGLPGHPGVPGELFRGALAAVWLCTLSSLPLFLLHGRDIRLSSIDGDAASQFALHVAAFILVALNEEAAIRGYVFRNLLLAVKPVVAVGISSVLFAALHLFNPNMTPLAFVNLLLAGAFLAFSILRWGSLWYALGFHFLWNLHLGVFLSLPVSGVPVPGLLDVPTPQAAWLTGGHFGPEGSLVTTLLLGVACFRMARGLPVDLFRSPAPPPCAGGEVCPAIPEELRKAAERWVDGEGTPVKPGPPVSTGS